MQSQQFFLLRKVIFGKASVALAASLFLGGAVGATRAAEAPVVAAPSITADLGTAERAGLNTLVTQNGTVYDISQGTQKGSILFHGFGQFGLKAGETANFLVPDPLIPSDPSVKTVQNIVARVNGGASTINGTLNSKSTGFWLINQNGIVIGPNATFNLNGALAITTADALLLHSDMETSASTARFFAKTDGVPTINSPNISGFSFLGANVIPDGYADIRIESLKIADSTSNGKTKHFIVGRDIDLSGEFNHSGKLHVMALNSTYDLDVSDSGLAKIRPLLPYTDVKYSSFANGGGTQNDSYLFGGDVVMHDFVGNNSYPNVNTGLMSIGKTITVANSNFASDARDGGSTVELYGNSVNLDKFKLRFGLGDKSGRPKGDLRIFSATDLFLTGIDYKSFEYYNSATSIFWSNGKLTIDKSNIVSSPDYDTGLVSGANATTTFYGKKGIEFKNSRLKMAMGADNFIMSGTGGSLYFTSEYDLIFENSSLDIGIDPPFDNLVRHHMAPTNLPFDRQIGEIVIKAHNMQLNNSTLVYDRSVSSSLGNKALIELNDGTLIIDGKKSGITLTVGSNDVEAIGNISKAYTLPEGLTQANYHDKVGELVINASGVVLKNGGSINASSAGLGSAGSITITADNIEITGDQSGISSTALAAGNAGNINLSSRKELTIGEGTNLSSATFQIGNAGAVTVNAADTATVAVAGVISSASCGSELDCQTPTANRGSAGFIKLKNGNYLVKGEITTSTVSDTVGSGSEGAIDISTKGTLTLEGDAKISTQTLAKADAGAIFIDAADVSIKDSAQIQAKTQGAGKAGEVKINTGALTINANSAQFSAGQEKITARELPSTLIPVAGIYSSSEGDALSLGAPGNIIVDATEQIILDAGSIDTSTASTIAGATSDGTITLNSPIIQLKNGALVTSESKSGADAGNITLNVADSIKLEDSKISTSATNANGGNIAIQNGNATTNSRLLQLNKSTISASAGTNGGNITIAADTIINIASTVKATGERGTNGDVVFTSPQLDVSTLITDLSVPVLDASRLLQQTCSAASARKASSFVVNKKPLNQAPGGYRLSRLNHAVLPLASTNNRLPAKALQLPVDQLNCEKFAGI